MQKTLDSNSFISLAKLRLREPIKNARESVKKLENNLTKDELKKTVGICAIGIKTIGSIAVEDLIAAQSLGFLNLLSELIHRVIDIARTSENLKKLGKVCVLEAIDEFIELINNILENLGSRDIIHKWTNNNCNLEDLSLALPLEECISPRKLTHIELQAHSKLYIFLGDLHRYQSNISHENYDSAIKAYWMAFSLDSGQGIIFNQLGVIESSTTKDNNYSDNNRLSKFFYFLRALYANTAFENAKEVLLSKLGNITDKMIQTDFAKHSEIFKNPSVTDINGIYASSVKNSGPHEYYFSWFKNDFLQAKPNWKRYLSKLSKPIIFKIQNDNFFHIINLLLSKQSHPTFSVVCERFLVLTQHLLEEEKYINGKELLQITTIFIFALKSRNNNNGNGKNNFSVAAVADESFETFSKTFLYFIGILFSKLFDFMEDFLLQNEEKDFAEINKTILPSIIIIESYWNSIFGCIPSNIYLSPSFTFDFSVIRKKICKLGKLLENYLAEKKVAVERSKADDHLSSKNNSFILPEIILSCWGSQFQANINPLRITFPDIEKNSNNNFQTFLIRLSLAQELLSKMVKKNYFGLTPDFQYLPSCHDLSSFELFALNYKKADKVHAIYPEYIVLDTNQIIDEYSKLKNLTQYGIKFIIPSVVWSELNSISKDRKKDETIKLAAKNAADIISTTIKNHSSNDFQIYNFYGERKFDLDFTPRDIAGLNNKTGRERARDNNDDFIITVCKKVEEIVEPISRKQGFYDSKIIASNLILITEDKILRIKARSENIPTCGFNDFFTWFSKCISVAAVAADASNGGKEDK